MGIKLMAFDLDGTLLNSEKIIDDSTMKALEAAALKGVEIVPCTGRFYKAMPECVLQLPFVNYSININGACAFDVKNEKSLICHEMPKKRVLELIEWYEDKDCAYDVYMNNWGYIQKDQADNIARHMYNTFYQKQIRDFRTHVENLKDFVAAADCDIQKFQVYSEDSDFILDVFRKTKEIFPDLEISSSEKNDIEYTNKQANKGFALRDLCDYLRIDIDDAMAFGDGGNDVELLKIAGIGVAMGNAKPKCKEAADFVTLSNDEGGIAYAIEKFVL